MQVKELYRYTRDGGGVTVSPTLPVNTEYEIRYRLIADEGGAITNGEVITECIDVDDMTGWRDATEEELEDYTVDGTTTGELDESKI